MSLSGGSPSYDIRVLDNYVPSNPFHWNWYILIVEFIEVINFAEVIETIIAMIT